MNKATDKTVTKEAEKEALSINLLFPVLNERLRLEKGIERTMAYLKENVRIPYSLTILDNGSEDETPRIGKALEKKYPEVTYVRVGERGWALPSERE